MNCQNFRKNRYKTFQLFNACFSWLDCILSITSIIKILRIFNMHNKSTADFVSPDQT